MQENQLVVLVLLLNIVLPLEKGQKILKLL